MRPGRYCIRLPGPANKTGLHGRRIKYTMTEPRTWVIPSGLLAIGLRIQAHCGGEQ